ncbi:hypothetical protein H2200_002395 [Cladophialophora chaetospira]|uniref:Uncharacterized protein n=1 Tax=Cladophialophora chaetospira TaxID=386627 RepID=A0AA39CN09_9EURO|nr:hypothetical protein H2200_002395 [Cladophialophora chaetospira]
MPASILASGPSKDLPSLSRKTLFEPLHLTDLHSSQMTPSSQVKEKANRAEYPGEGGRQFVPRPEVDLLNRASSLGTSPASVRTDDSRFLSDESFDNSYEVNGQFNGHHTAGVNITGIGHQFAGSEEEEDGHHAWPLFISPTNSLAHIPHEDDDSSGMVIPGLEMDDSTLAMRGSDANYDQRSVLSSEYETSFVQPSPTASQVLTGAGTAFENFFLVRPLRLTPDCRHSINNPICAHCMH